MQSVPRALWKYLPAIQAEHIDIPATPADLPWGQILQVVLKIAPVEFEYRPIAHPVHAVVATVLE